MDVRYTDMVLHGGVDAGPLYSRSGRPKCGTVRSVELQRGRFPGNVCGEAVKGVRRCQTNGGYV